MAAKKGAQRAPRTTVTLPSSIESEEVVWPGQSRTANAGLRAELTEIAKGMDFGSVRRLNVAGTAAGTAEQKATLTMFRSVVSNVFNDEYGVRAVFQPEGIVVKIVEKVYRTRKNVTQRGGDPGRAANGKSVASGK